jgi:hypothetical protein
MSFLRSCLSFLYVCIPERGNPFEAAAAPWCCWKLFLLYFDCMIWLTDNECGDEEVISIIILLACHNSGEKIICCKNCHLQLAGWLAVRERRWSRERRRVGELNDQDTLVLGLRAQLFLCVVKVTMMMGSGTVESDVEMSCFWCHQWWCVGLIPYLSQSRWSHVWEQFSHFM